MEYYNGERSLIDSLSTLSSKNPQLRRSVGLLVFAAIAIFGFIPFTGGKFFYVLREATNAGHVPGFFVLYLVVSFMLAKFDLKLVKRIALAFAIGASFAGVLEITQPFFGRDCSLDDLKRSCYGLAFGAVIEAAYLEMNSLRRKVTIALTLCAFVVLNLFLAVPIFQEFQVFQLRSARFPILSKFDNPLEVYQWEPIFSELTFRQPSGLEIKTQAKQFSGAKFKAKYDDWSAFKALAISVTNPGEPLQLRIRVDDDGDVYNYQGRFNRIMTVPSGLVTLEIPIADIENGPKGRLLNLTMISGLMLFVGEEGESEKTFTLNSIQLLKWPKP